MNKGVAMVLGLAVVAGGAIVFWPSKASASPLSGGGGGGAGPIDEGKPVNPKNAAEAYSLGMNPKMTDAAYVQKLATWMNSSGNRPDWAAALQKRAYDLQAETLFAEGLKDTTTETRIIEIGNILKSTHEALATVLGLRIAVMRGQAPPPAFQLQLPSGSGVLTIDLSVFSPHATSTSPGAGSISPVGPSPGGATAAPAGAPPGAHAATQNTAPPGAPSNAPPASAPPGLSTTAIPGQPSASPVNAHPLAAEEVKPENDPFGTVALARVLLTEQTKPSWKYSPNEAVKQWQAKVGLTADGKFGPGSALRMAQEVGVLPWVRYFAKGAASKAAAVNDFRGRVKAYALSIIKTKPELAGALLVSADAEQGQGWPATTPTAAPAKAPTPEQIDAAIAVLMKQADSRTV